VQHNCRHAGGVKEYRAMASKRQCIEIPGVAHTGGGGPGFIPFGTRVGDMLFSGASFGADPATGKLPPTREEQAKFAFRNARTLVETAGFSTDDIAHMFVWCKDFEARDAINDAWVEMFPDPHNRPARHPVKADLPGDMFVQLEITAVRGAGKRECVEIPGVAHTILGQPGFIPFGVRMGDYLFSGACFGQDPTTGKLGATPDEEARLAFQNMRTLLETSGFTPDDVAHIFVWYTDHALREAVNDPWEEMFPDVGNRPARHAIKAELPGNMNVHIEIIAVRGARRECIEIGGISHALRGIPGYIPFGVKMGNMLFSSATFGADPATGQYAATAEEQAEQAFRNTRTLLDKAGFTTDDVAHMFVWYRDHQYRNAVNKPFVEMFPDQNGRPARHAVVTDIPGNALLQIEIIAIK
jgi:2-iminobutanoate/2-iminopropanoate deaminase